MGHSGLQCLVVSPLGSMNSHMKKRAFLARRTLELLSLAATVGLLGCAGVSTPGDNRASTPASPHTVNLSWNASTSAGITGYNIYRAVYSNSCGDFARINSALNTSTQYTDTGVTGGTSYCYATTAVNASNQESGYSNIVSNLQIPAP